MTAQVIDFRSRRHVRIATPEPTVIPTPAWWTCPTWCADGDDCNGGETIDFGSGRTLTTSRMHHGVLFAESVADVDGGTVEVKVEVGTVEDPDEGFIETPTVTISVDGLITDPDTAERIANAILAAAAAARQPLPAACPLEVTR